jgi:hypothetical protein
MNPLSLINLSLEIVYCGTTLSGHDIIRLDSSRVLKWDYGMGFVINPYLNSNNCPFIQCDGQMEKISETKRA